MTRTLKYFTALAAVAAMMAPMNSCSKQEEAKIPTQEEIQKHIIGRWKTVNSNGYECITNSINVVNYVSLGKSYRSISKTGYSTDDQKWNKARECQVTIEGNVISETSASESDPHISFMEITEISAISDNSITATFTHVTFRDGVKVGKTTEPVVLGKVSVDYSTAIVGLWEGVSSTGSDTYGDINHRWEYRADGSYTYYSKDDKDNWAPSTNTMNEYFVDGDWLAFRWKDGSNTEFREWWTIESCDDTSMIWSALREETKAVRTFRTTFALKKIK